MENKGKAKRNRKRIAELQEREEALSRKDITSAPDDFLALLEQHYRKNFKKLVAIHRGRDVVHDAYERTLKYWDSYNPKHSFDTWFHSILINAKKDWFITEKLHGATVESSRDILVDHTPHNQMSSARVKEINELISLKPLSTQLILQLALMRGYSYKGIKDVTGASKNKIQQAVKNFRKEIIAAGV